MDFARALAHRLGVEPAADNDRTEASVPIDHPPSGRGQTRSATTAAPQIPAARVHRSCDPGRASSGGDRPGADPVPRDREAAQRRLHPAAVGAAPDRPTRRGAAALVVTAPTTTVTASARRLPRRPWSAPTARRWAAPPPPPTATPSTARRCSPPAPSIWSISQGEIPAPTVTVTTEVTDEPLPLEEETPVRVCMQETGKTRRECREAIRASNDGGN